MSKRKQNPTWVDLKRQLTGLDQAALLSLIQDLYAASKSNQTFLHARFDLGADVLKPYKAIIERWVCPDVMRNQGISVAKAKKAIADYKKAIGSPQGMAELSVYYCECCMHFLGYCGMFMFERALKAVALLEPKQQTRFLVRLKRVRNESHHWAWGLNEDMDPLMAEYAPDASCQSKVSE